MPEGNNFPKILDGWYTEPTGGKKITSDTIVNDVINSNKEYRTFELLIELIEDYNNSIYLWEKSNKELTLEKFKKKLWRKIIATLPCGF